MIQVYNRQEGKYEIEKVAGDKYLKWCYESPIGKSLTELFIKKKLFLSFMDPIVILSLAKEKYLSLLRNLV